MTTATGIAALLLILPVSPSTWSAQGERAVIESPLSRKEHPRLLLTRGMLPALRKRCRTDYATEYAAMVRWADAEAKILASKEWKERNELTDPEIRSLLAFSFLWQVTQERRYAETAVTLLEVYARAVAARPWTDSQSWRTGRPTAYVPRRYFGNIAVIYDLLHDALTPAQRASIGRVILDGVGGKRNVPGMGYRLTSFLGAGKAAGVLAVHGDGIDDVEVEGLRSALTDYLQGTLLPEFRVVSKRRGAWIESMHCGCFEEYWLPLFWFLTNSTGQNYFQNESVLRGMGAWYVYNIFRFGTGPNGNVVPVSSIHHGGVDTKGAFGLPICAAGSGDGLTAWLVRQDWWQKNRKLVLDALPPRDAWFKILFLDPAAKLVRPQDLPETALFEAIGWVSMRSSWKPDATFAHFKCGMWRRGEPAHLDNNSFYIYKNGPLAIDGIKPGTTDDPSHPGTRLEKLVPYGRMTLAHNTVTVYDPDEKIMGVSQYSWRRARRPFPVNDGGQTFRADKLSKKPERLEQGRIVAYETHRLFDYACGDATESYNPSKLKHFTRQFVFLKPDLFVVFDRVVSANAEFPKHWLLHSYKEPEIAGNTVMIDAPDGGPRTGRLFCRTILPKTAHIAKYPRATLVRSGKDITPEFWKTTEDSWRLEVSPSGKRVDDVFLHVLYAGDRSNEKMPAVERIERRGQVGVRLSGSRRYEVTFARSGPVSGHISIVDGDTPLVARKLAESIDDSYDGWRNDPRYKTWAAQWTVFPERPRRSKR